MYYDRDGKQIDQFSWVALHNDPKYKRVAFDVVPETRIEVSTVWLGLNHNYGDGEPLIFETMIFTDPHNSMIEEFCDRYATEQEAIDGHNNAVQMVLVTLGVANADAIMKKRE